MHRSAVRAPLLAAVMVAAIASPRQAGADELTPVERKAEMIGILEVRVTGLPDEVTERFENTVVDALETAGYRKIVKSEPLAELLAVKSDYVEGCTFGRCLIELRAVTGINTVVVARVRGDGSSYHIVVSLIATDDGQVRAQTAVSCPACTIGEAVRTFRNAVDMAANAPDAGASAAAVAVKKPAGKAAGSSSARPAAWAFLAVAVVAGGAGGYLLGPGDKEPLGAGLLGAGLTAGVASATLFLLSGEF